MFVLTTPTGNVGSAISQLLLQRASAPPFRLAAHHPERVMQRYGPEVACTRFDFADPSTWQETLADISILFLLCPRPEPRLIREHILPFLDAAIEAGCQYIIFLSVPGADRVKVLPHALIERHIEASGIAYTFLRPTYFMQNFIRRDPTHGVDIAVYHEVFLPVGKGRMSLIDTHDVAQVVLKICEHPEAHNKRSYFLTGSESLTMAEVAETFSRCLHLPIHYTSPSIVRFWSRLRKRDVPWLLLLIMTVEYTLARFGKSGTTTQTLARLLATPPRTLAQFISENRWRWETQSWVG